MENNWTSDIEILLNKIRINSLRLSDYHRTNYLKLKDFIMYFRIPVLCLSSLNSVFSVGLNSFVSQNVVSVLNCLISLVCGIICSIELFLQIQRRMDIHNSSSINLYCLSVEIFKILSLDRNNRNINASSFLDEKHQEYIKFRSDSNPLEINIKDLLLEIPIQLDLQLYDGDQRVPVSPVSPQNQVIIDIPTTIPTRPVGKSTGPFI